MKVLSENRKSGYNYNIEKTYNCGVVLTGSEVKMVKNKKYHFNESFCYYKDGELWIKNFYIDEYNQGFGKQEPKRDKKLLLKKKELINVGDFFKIKSNAVIPTTVFLSERGFIKIKVGLGTGKKNYDKRTSLKEKEMKRDVERAKNI